MNERKINIALAGYANVGKSVIFNHFTGLHQHIGNWPGKTIEKAEGTLHYKGYTIDVLDLPGIYSLSTYSLEELITREYIVCAKPDFIANVIDATNLERNLTLTLQLLELEKPKQLNLELEKIHGHSSSIVIADERCHLASQISKQVMTVTKPQKISFHEALDILTGHRIWGYPVMIAILGLVFFTVFKGGNYISSAIEQSLSGLQPYFYSVFGSSILATLTWSGIAGFIALIEVALPYILPFYFFLYVLEDFGYLAR